LYRAVLYIAVGWLRARICSFGNSWQPDSL
jgi:hypothetical protein